MFGKAGAKFVLSPEGPYKSYMLTKDIKQFVELSLPRIWSSFFDGGAFTARFENNVAYIKITGIDIKHIYFEDIVIGFNQQAIKVFRKNTVAKRIRSISSGNDDFYFQLELKDS